MTSDDLAQETFIKAYTHLSQFRATASFSTWLYRIAYNVFYDYTRKLKSEQKTTDNQSLQKVSERGVTSSSGLTYDLQQALAVLSAGERCN